MALDWITRVNSRPALLGICAYKTTASYDAIVKTGKFSINVLTTDMVIITEYTGLVSGKRSNKFEQFDIFMGS